MLTFTIRRLILSVPTLLFISLAIFLLLELSPGDPMAQVPLTVPPDVKEKMRQALGLGQPWHIRYWKWLVQFFWVEPLVFVDWLTGSGFSANYQRMISWQTRGPVMALVVQSLPQTMWVVAMSYVVGVLIAIPIGIYSAYRHYSIFDQSGTFITMVGFSIPPFFTGPLMIVIFAVQLGWLPSTYNTVHKVLDWDSFVIQLKQMVLPIMVLSLQTTAQISRYMRSSMLDNLKQDYVLTARAKGLSEWIVVMVHALRNSMIPVVTVIALGIPSVFGGAIITENVFKVNGLGYQLLIALFASDIPTVMTFTFIFAVLIVFFNLVADILYGVLDPRIRYE
ncbi:MAG: ABC transporter permease [Rhodobacteraceae bacterium]|nr:ABC transporter permease [Paracoccaceae bacterium]